MSNTTKIKFEQVKKFESVDALGITVDLVAGTKKRNPVTGRTIITEAAGFGVDSAAAEGGADNVCCVADCPAGRRDRVLQTVTKKTAKLVVKLVTGETSFADGFDLGDCYVANDKDNPGVVDVFVDKTDAEKCSTVDMLMACASRMCEAHPEACGYWTIVFAEAPLTRVFIRGIVPVNEDGTAALSDAD